MFALNLPLACVTTAVQSWIPSNLQVSSLHYQKFTRFNLWKKRKRAWWIEIHIEPLKCTRVVHARYSETKNVPVILCKYRVKHENCNIQVHQNETNTHGHLKSEYCTKKRAKIRPHGNFNPWLSFFLTKLIYKLWNGINVVVRTQFLSQKNHKTPNSSNNVVE